MEKPKRKRRASPGKIHKIALENQKTLQLGTENFEKVENESVEQYFDLIENELLNHSILKNLTKKEISQLCPKFFVCIGQKNQYLFNQDDTLTEHFFIVLEGELKVEINGVEIKTYEDQGSFGDMALMYNAPRSASVKFETRSKMLALSSQSFKKVLKDIKIKQYEENKEFLGQAKFFENLSKTDLDKLSSEAMSMYFKPGKIYSNKNLNSRIYHCKRRG